MVLLLKVLLAPFFVLVASSAQRRWGQAVGGRIVGLPLTSLPLLFVLVVSEGSRYAAAAAGATLAGVSGQAVLTWAYARHAGRHSPLGTVVVSVVAFAAAAVVLSALSPRPVVAAVLATVVTAALLRWWPATTATASASGASAPVPAAARNSTALRMMLAAGFALLVSEMASPLGPHLAGLVAALPVLSLVMFALTHRDDGVGAVVELAYGVQRGTFSVITALLVLTLMLPTGQVLLAFASAVAASVLAQLASGLAGHDRAATAPADRRRAAMSSRRTDG